MDEKDFRSQVTWLAFLFGILVIWIHSNNTELFRQAAAAAQAAAPAGAAESAERLWAGVSFLEEFLGNTLGQIAVPGFFLLSSYLFFRDFSMEKLKEKWRRRVFSILLPYVAWNMLYYLAYAAATRLPALRGLTGRERVLLSVPEVLRAVFSYAYAPIFWYLYQLIILIILSPLLWLLVRRRVTGFLYLLLLLLAVRFGLDTQHPNTDALFYYSLAAYGAVHGKELVEHASGAVRLRAGLVCLALAAVSLGLTGQIDSLFPDGGTGLALPGLLSLFPADFSGMVFASVQGLAAPSVVWTVLFRASFPAALWFLLSCRRFPVKPFMRQSLFLYAVHYGVVRFAGKVSAAFFGGFLPDGGLAVAAACVYLLMPAFAAAVSYGLALFLSRFCPPVWRVLSGGRSL